MPEYKDIATRLREASKRTDLPTGIVSLLSESYADIERLRAERDEARLQTGRIFNEIDCRIEHGAESNGHLEAIRNLFKDKP